MALLRWKRTASFDPRGTAIKAAVLAGIPLILVLISIVGPFRTDALFSYSGLAVDGTPKLVAGEPSIDPNFGVTAQALGKRAALEVLTGHLPVWNHYQGLGAPLLGEMQSAALFPPTWLLALPHGQTIEQCLLQLFAGVGAFLFFRRVGSGPRAALAGGIALEVNGVFAWLRNAIFNPVAFLPWLLLSLEGLRANALAERQWPQRLPMIALGACMAALALYAGFPEEVYLYGLMLMAWALFRMRTLSIRHRVRFATDLLLTGAVALALSAPLLVSFADYLGVAELGGHDSNGFAGMSLGAHEFLQYFVPYVFGPIFGGDHPVVNDAWGGTGGYVGFVPVVYAAAALFIPGHRSTKGFLVAWIALALSVTHGVPGIHQLFMMIPLTKSAAVFRYLNISWIFCFVYLSVLFLDDVASASSQGLKRILLLGIGFGIVLLASAIVMAWPLLAEQVTRTDRIRFFLRLSLAGVGALLVAVWGAGCLQDSRRRATALAGIMILEAAVWFAVPYLSYPRRGTIDLGLVAFLRANIGYQRVVGTAEASLSPNYGSYFGIASLNYDDLPSPKLTANYVKEKLDPYAGSIAFVPSTEGLSPEQQADRKRIFRARLSAYAQAGVKYVLAGPDFNVLAPFRRASDEASSFTFGAGQQIDISGQGEAHAASTVTAALVGIEAPDRQASGHLKFEICAEADCAEGTADLASAEEGQALSIALDHPVEIKPGTSYTIRLTQMAGSHDVALTAYPLGDTEPTPTVRGSPASIPDGFAPDIRLAVAGPALAYAGASMSAYELPDVRNYVSAEGCRVTAVSRDLVDTSCSQPSKLTRLELWMRGWSASVNDVPAEVGLTDGAFQGVQLPAGKARVRFRYEPHGFRQAIAAAGFALSLVCTILAWALKGRLDRARLSAT